MMLKCVNIVAKTLKTSIGTHISNPANSYTKANSITNNTNAQHVNEVTVANSNYAIIIAPITKRKSSNAVNAMKNLLKNEVLENT